MRGKNKYLVQWKGFIAESDTWKGKKNLENAKEAIKEFKKEYQWDIEDIRREEREEGIFTREEFPGRFIARKLYRWIDKRYDEEYWAILEKYHKWPLTDLWVNDLIIKRLKKAKFRQ